MATPTTDTLDDILALIHQRETALQNELARLSETKRLLTPQDGAKDTGRASTPTIEGDDAIPHVAPGWSAARKKRHSLAMKKRWAERKKKAAAK